MRFQLISGLSCAALSYRARFIPLLAPGGWPYGRRQPRSAAGPAHPRRHGRTDAAGAVNATGAAEVRAGTGAGRPSSRAGAVRSLWVGRARRRPPLAGRTARSRRGNKSRTDGAGHFRGGKAEGSRAGRAPRENKAARCPASRRTRGANADKSRAGRSPGGGEAERFQAGEESRARGSFRAPLAATGAGRRRRAETSNADKATGIASGFERRLARPNRGNAAVCRHF
jgi:hypothetical protein